ncbi:hypothetical protein POSPLADRAFT_1157652 [Postia placenta MAD-698-R-SB12]|uniref:F-box domain-containing protein n=1 Tax=Postia placenta MAD-698-R-SB12 TaxID=670580 RepID=A0A1X6MLQ1_9APHY|nr:hypothetical protein POSPLADRAFT_1157652 [Postia placenta MAD-698-R-SB12]OSX57146.1 hypothetical protein POSPLADRAFT_1157652 [Postia placenta MAD-698-R-SB12]
MPNEYGDSLNEAIAPHQITPSPNPNPRPRRISMADILDDVLVLIFYQVFKSTGQRSHKKGIHFPESVASVCARWRAVMFSVSEFWSVLLIGTSDWDMSTQLPVICQVETVTPTTGTLEAPILESMDIHGMSLRQMFDCGTPMLPKVNEIRIDGYDYHEFPPFPVADFVRLLYKLPSLRTLRCSDIELTPSGDELAPPDLGNPPEIKVVEFTRMDGDCIQEISSRLGRPTVPLAHYTKCRILEPLELFRTSGSCILTDMDTDWDILNILKDQNGPQCSTLHIEGSPFWEDMVELLAGPLPDGSWICPNLTELILSGCCEGFFDDRPAQRALVNMIKARDALYNSTGLPPQGHPDHVVSSLTRLTVDAKGRFGRYIEADDLEWLDANLASVRWGDWSGGTKEHGESESSTEETDSETNDSCEE